MMGAIYCLVIAFAAQPPPGWRVATFEVTAYCPCPRCCGRYADGITASGVPARGRLVAAPPEYPFGTEVVVPGYGRARVADRGSAIRSAGRLADGRRLRYDRLDVLMPTHREAQKWGRRVLRVLVRES